MVRIETTIEVDEQGRAVVQLPAGLKPGPHRAIVILFDETETAPTPSMMDDFPRHEIPWPEGFTARREEIYGDDGR